MAEGNPDTGAGAAGDPNAAGSTDPNATGSPSTGDPVSLLTSRLNGQTAKVGELTGQNKTLAEEIAKRDKLIADLQSGKVSAEESAKALVEAKDKELAFDKTVQLLIRGSKTGGLEELGRCLRAPAESRRGEKGYISPRQLRARPARREGPTGPCGT
jgi:hypothetical protein